MPPVNRCGLNEQQLLDFAKKYGLAGKTSLEIARAVGRKTCKRGHVSKRMKDGHCAECRKSYQRQYQLVHQRNLRANPIFRQQENKATRERMRLRRSEQL